jgi:class 3 adenylate cyclase
VPSRFRFVLDEHRTARRMAEEGICEPVLRPAAERWLRLTLVVDTGAGCDIWRDTAREFLAVLGCLGAFRDVRAWSLDTDARPPRLVPGAWDASTTMTPRHPKELTDPSGRTLIAVLSSCVSLGWYAGNVAGILNGWAAHGPVVLLSLLPEHLWARTALALGTAVRLSAPGTGVPNRGLRLAGLDAWPGEAQPSGVGVPVAVLEPGSIGRWADLVAGKPGSDVPGFVFGGTGSVVPEPAVRSDERVEAFRQMASPVARQLAGLLAASPVVSLSVLRLIRQSLLPEARQTHEAEVLLGGLLTRSPGADPTDPRFEFHSGVRESLLDATPTDRSVSVLGAVSEYVGAHLASGRTFAAVLADPGSATGEVVADESPFARIAAGVLLRAGGEYARLVQPRFGAVPNADTRTAAPEDAAAGGGEAPPANPQTEPSPDQAQPLTLADLEGLPFTNPTAALKAMEQVPNVLRLATNEQTLFRQMLKVVLDALPRADSAGVVLIPPDVAPGGTDLRITTLDYHTRGIPKIDERFEPRRKLVHTAVQQRMSCLHVLSVTVVREEESGRVYTVPDDYEQWLEDNATPYTRPYQPNTTPWAICTPFQDGSKCALYLSGKLAGQKIAEDPRTKRDLTEYQKVAELLVGIIETGRKSLRLARQNALVRHAWPRSIRKFLDDPDHLEMLLKPRRIDVTVLICDLRGSSLFAEKGAGELVKAWHNVAGALDDMSQAVAVNEGMVTGIQGDVMMACWGWPEAQEGQIEKALKAAARIQQVFNEKTVHLRVGLVLAHGWVIAGRLGANDLAKVDVYGPLVNLATRLETVTKSFGVNVLVNEAVAAKVAEADPYGSRYRTRRLGRVRPQGMRNAFVVSELLLADSPNANPGFLEQWERMIDLFTAGDWASAHEGIDSWFADDPAARCLLRLMDRTNRFPPANWDGSFTPDEPDD